MVSLSASGEIFSLSLSGQADADGWARAGGKGVVSSNIVADLSLCHGISASLGASIVAEAEAKLGALFLIAASGQADASAQAGAFARAKFSGDVFNDFGAVLGVGAEASVAASAQVSAGLDVNGIARAAEAALGDSFALGMFTAFLNEVRIEGGAGVRATAIASARTNVGLAGNLLDNPATFKISAESEASVVVGGGGEVFFICEIADSRRMALTISELAAAEIAHLGRQQLPEELHFLLEWFELLAPATTGIIWELGQHAALETLGPPEAVATRVVDAVMGRLQTLLLDRAVDAGLDLVTQLLGDVGYKLRLTGDASSRESLADAIDKLADSVPQHNLSIGEVTDFAARLLELLVESLGSETARVVRRPLALLWTAASIAIALRDPYASGEYSARVIGAGQVVGDSWRKLAFPPPPEWVRDEWKDALDRAISGDLELADYIDALVALGIEQVLGEAFTLRPLLTEFGGALDLSIGDLIHTVIAVERSDDLSGTPVYRALRELLGRTIDELIMGRLMPELRAALPRDSTTRRWLEEAALPSLLGVRSFVLGRVDNLVDGSVGDDLTPFLSEFRAALGVLAGKVVLRNLLVLSFVLEDHQRETVAANVRTLAGQVLAGRGGVIAADWRAIVASFTPPLINQAAFNNASRELLGGLLFLTADIMEAEPANRRSKRREAMEKALRVDDLTVDYSVVDDVAGFIRSVMDCNTVPDPSAVLQVAGFQLTTLSEQALLGLQGVAALLEKFFAALLVPNMEEHRERFNAFVDALDRQRKQAIVNVRNADRELQKALKAFDDATLAFDNSLRQLRRTLRTQAQRDRVKEAIRVAGRAQAIKNSGGLGGAAFDTAWFAANWLFDPAMVVLSALASELSNVLASVRNANEAVAAAADYISNELIEVLESIDLLGLKDWFPDIDALARNVAATVVRHGPLNDELKKAGRQRKTQREAGTRRSKAQSSLNSANAARASEVAKSNAVSRNAVTPKIVAPLATPQNKTAQPAVHNGTVTLRIKLPGGDHRLLGEGRGRRLQVRLNGQPLTLSPQHLQVGKKGNCRLTRPMTSADGLKTGVNVVECFIVSPGQPKVDRVAFAWMPSIEKIGTGIQIDLIDSRLDLDGVRPLDPVREHVAVINAGEAPVGLLGWRLQDRSGHKFRFPEGELAPGATLRLHTGAGDSTPAQQFWGRQQTMWKNQGEPITLIRPSGAVHQVVVTGEEQ
ncbi:lamin tail domain-containing protein [Kocuria kalidii]|uniref:lamin tail domain-containing protein n=1 Tax=Kocuria kalidii TaxID=3376283 RepID=UPI003795E33C